MPVSDWVKAIVDGVCSPPKYGVGDTVMIDGKPCKIVSGQYWGAHGISNHWTWRPVRGDGTLGARKCGYGDDWLLVKRSKPKQKRDG